MGKSFYGEIIMTKIFKSSNLFFLSIFCCFIISCPQQSHSSNGGGSNNDFNNYYRQEMRNFVHDISSYAKGLKNGFLIIPQNGQELLTGNGEEDGNPVLDYINAIDGMGREDLFYGYDNDDIITPSEERDYMITFLDIAKNNGIKILVTDYCWTQSKVDNSYLWNNNKSYISFAADHRELDNIPVYPVDPYNVSSDNINSLSNAKNFLYLINPDTYFIDKNTFINAIDSTNYDILIIDLFYNNLQLSSADLTQLKTKANGGTRLVIAYMSIGEAEDYRYYWNSGWESNPPDWLAEENNDWPGNYKVRYWYKGWQDIIFGNDSSYLKKIVDTGFDGVYLDIIDAFEYFEN